MVIPTIEENFMSSVMTLLQALGGMGVICELEGGVGTFCRTQIPHKSQVVLQTFSWTFEWRLEVRKWEWGKGRSYRLHKIIEKCLILPVVCLCKMSSHSSYTTYIRCFWAIFPRKECQKIIFHDEKWISEKLCLKPSAWNVSSERWVMGEDPWKNEAFLLNSKWAQTGFRIQFRWRGQMYLWLYGWRQEVCCGWVGFLQIWHVTWVKCTVIVARMSHWKWSETKQEPSRARSGHQISCCLVSLHFLCDILALITVYEVKSVIK